MGYWHNRKKIMKLKINRLDINNVLAWVYSQKNITHSSPHT